MQQAGRLAIILQIHQQPVSLLQPRPHLSQGAGTVCTTAASCEWPFPWAAFIQAQLDRSTSLHPNLLSNIRPPPHQLPPRPPPYKHLALSISSLSGSNPSSKSEVQVEEAQVQVRWLSRAGHASCRASMGMTADALSTSHPLHPYLKGLGCRPQPVQRGSVHLSIRACNPHWRQWRAAHLAVHFPRAPVASACPCWSARHPQTRHSYRLHTRHNELLGQSTASGRAKRGPRCAACPPGCRPEPWHPCHGREGGRR